MWWIVFFCLVLFFFWELVCGVFVKKRFILNIKWNEILEIGVNLRIIKLVRVFFLLWLLVYLLFIVVLDCWG